jgi:hypothetical protein
MNIHISEDELHSLGMQIDPDNPTQAIHIAPQAESIPDESWDLDRLGDYARTGLSDADRFKRESIQLGRRSTVQIFRAGHALSIARRKVPWGEWGPWLATRNIKRTTAWEAIELYQRAGSEEAIANLTPVEAKRRYGIGKPPRTDNQEATRPLNPSSDSSSQSEDEQDDGEPGDAEPIDEQDDGEPGDAERNEESYDEPDVIARPPRTVRDMLVASSNLLLSCVERSDEVDAACGVVLAEIETSVKQLQERIAS